jgi:hypothetical protein
MTQPTDLLAKPPKAVLDLIERFGEHIEEYRSGRYNETQLRRDFLDPFWKALGWDIDNEKDYAEAYRDVVHEDAVKVGDATKAPDYGFRIGGARKFFLEAKKPSVVVKDDVSAAYQLRRYAWSASLPLSILSDFEEFAVYDARVKPAPNDSASKARLFYCTFRDYAANWEFIAGTFSRDAVLKGSFDRYANSKTKKRGTTSVDNAFLDEIEGWRKVLAQNLALRNAKLSQRELNFAVQRIIDRVIFLRICEDRGIEKYGRLRALAEGEGAYGKLTKLFREADDRYNSGLFHFSAEKGRGEAPDLLTPKLKVDDKVLRDILKGLYYPQSPYEFSVISADMLGQVYERFLGNTIELSAGHRAKVVEKPEVRKAGGVYYTPTYIVDYIVKNTVGKLLEGKTPKQAAKLKVLDPACGSGSFLIGAYQHLLDWHLAWYVKDGAAKHAKGKKPVLYQTQGGGWALTLAERKRILLDNIYGVDIDSQAVEVTKLSLVLKVLEGETGQSVDSQLKLFQERALPDLGSNIKCGNSLIGPDFYAQKGLGDFSDEERYRVNVFDWKTEFPEIMKCGGFDAVIGNPPYVRIQTMQDTQPQEVEFFSRTYRAARQGNYDIYVVFVERALSLVNTNGQVGVILPNKFFNAHYGQPLRELLSKGKHLCHVVHFGHQQVFANASTYTCLLFLLGKGTTKCDFVKVDDLDEWRGSGSTERAKISLSKFGAAEWNVEIGAKGALRTRLPELGQPLGEVAHLFVGLQTSADRIYVLAEPHGIESGILKPFITTGALQRYSPANRNAWLLFPYEVEGEQAKLLVAAQIEAEYPKAWRYLVQKREVLLARNNGKVDPARWYGYVYPKNLSVMEAPKLIMQVTSKEPTVLFDDGGLYMTGGGAGPFYGIRPLADAPFGIKYLLGVLNSKVFGWVVRTQSTPLRGGYVKYSKQYIEKTPIPQPDKVAHDMMVSLVEQMLDLHKRLPSARTPQEKTSLERQIAATDAQIDRLVYDLYGLTKDEIKIVEGTA